MLGCVAFLSAAAANALDMPNARLTPGALGRSDVAPADTAARVCTPGYARSVRHRYDYQWRRYRTAIFREYGIPYAQWRGFTIDHLVPLELGGRPFGTLPAGWDLRNVWPEPKAEAKQKDAVEGALHASVCYCRGYRGLHLSLAGAQRAIERDWRRTPVGLPPMR